ncbi:prepilin-type N-terminal cleavage/methylation domain-containing protein [Pedobacter changchengzhani]|uniref:Prepilin-type N-terminal cleavage/methylation domain-containing protein n=1 Tax=Pedobacter changchengzhani TaxID=2529274 RepID=A0A4R5MHV2_9SPHI|nr:prepilin-type N-terminal cleavage/methylation domain-containing protein [Pedobacter changchengzhani]TDG35147.1 prepilin-type N-terminal cleavage/methylation domain-containing protein [Pedobacter changchengzhani]
MKLKLYKKINAYTLTEILVVLVIIGILVLLALPNLMPLITKAKTTETKLQLEHLAKLEQSYFFEHSKYSNNFNEVGFIQETLTTDGKVGNANYKIQIISATNTSFLAEAATVADFDGDGTYNFWQISHRMNIDFLLVSSDD